MEVVLAEAGVLAAFGILVAAPAHESIASSYDAPSRLVEVSSSGTVNYGQVVAARFDAAGNRSSYSVGRVANGSFELPAGGDGSQYNPALVNNYFAGFSGLATQPIRSPFRSTVRRSVHSAQRPAHSRPSRPALSSSAAQPGRAHSPAWLRRQAT